MYKSFSVARTIVSLVVPLYEGLYFYCSYKVAMEETSKRSEGLGLGGASVDAPASSTPRSTSLQRAISQNARPDYTCYSLQSQDGEAVAVLIEAKLLSNSSVATVQPQVSSFVCNLLPCACNDITLVFPSRVLDISFHFETRIQRSHRS